MTYTITVELVVVVVGLVCIIVPGVYWIGRFAQRLDTVEKAGDATDRRVDALLVAIDALRKELLVEIRRHPVIRCPMHGSEGCALGTSVESV